ncbi:MAG: Uncharacterized protein CEN88_109 [Candidatus Berkelbacteria bacterium Licking1014_2]|uniref:Integral membrane protein n=1 Tax=Candidatus Berkelbacteria bacterium Licking1014_2 TaxID=2017146 RepID=A0A554LWJ9_9BACT|nr:MAG: Uncharacterized protein CEN88_109 [Candidatus Berkelbacteria bacterium Licking1014_2]
MLKSALFSIFTITVFSLGVVLLALFNIDPWRSDILTLAAVYGALFLLISGVLTLIGFYARIKIYNYEVIFVNLAPAVRQGVLIAAIIIALLTLQNLRVLSYWDAGLIVLAAVCLELFFHHTSIK